VRSEQCQRSRPDRARQRFDRLYAVQAAEVANSWVAITVRLFDGAAAARVKDSGNRGCLASGPGAGGVMAFKGPRRNRSR
jgi:hypothetical protein